MLRSFIFITLTLPIIAYADVTLANNELNLSIKQATKSVLNTYYNLHSDGDNATFDQHNNCYHTKYNSNTGIQDYCLKTRAEIKVIDGERTLYLMVHGKTLEETAQATNGLGGLFVLKELYRNHWYLSYRSPYIEIGQGGYSPLGNLKLTQIGQSNYGWTGEIAHSGSGQYVKYWTMYAPVDSLENDIKEVAQHNTLYEYNLSGNQGTVTIDNSEPQPWYPLMLTDQACDFNNDTSECTVPEISYMKYSQKQIKYIKLTND